MLWKDILKTDLHTVSCILLADNGLCGEETILFGSPLDMHVTEQLAHEIVPHINSN